MTRVESFGHRIGSGAGIVVTSIAAWPMKAENGEKKTGRWIVLGGTGWLTEQLVARTHPLGLVVAAGFIAGAWVKGTAPESQTDTAEAATDEAADNVALVEFILGVIGDRQGIHLAELLPAIQAHSDHWAGCDKTYLRTVLVAAGIPVRKKMRVGDQTGIPGVHRDDAHATLERLTTPPEVAAPTDAPSGDVDAGRSTCDPAL